jgi:hypothetical protein
MTQSCHSEFEILPGISSYSQVIEPPDGVNSLLLFSLYFGEQHK